MTYPNRMKSWNLGLAKSLELNDKKMAPDSNIGSFFLVHLWGLCLKPKSHFLFCLSLSLALHLFSVSLIGEESQGKGCPLTVPKKLISQNMGHPKSVIPASGSLTCQVAIIGGGAAGLSCANQCLSNGFSTVVIDTADMNAQYTMPLSHWPLIRAPNWKTLLSELKSSCENMGGLFLDGAVVSLTQMRGLFYLKTSKQTITSPVCVLATGKRPSTPGYPIIPKDSPRVLRRLYTTEIFTPSDTIAIIGDDEQTITTALTLNRRANKILVFSKKTRFPSVAMKALRELPHVTLMPFDHIVAVRGVANGVYIEYTKERAKLIQNASWVVLGELWEPQSSIAHMIAQLDLRGAIITWGEAGATNTPGLYACGEVATHRFLPGIAAMASGICAGNLACQYLLEKGESPQVMPIPTLPEEKGVVPKSKEKVSSASSSETPK